MVDVLENDELATLLEKSGKERADRGRYYGIPGSAMALLIKRGWVVSEIRDFYVTPEDRRKGYGRELLQHLVEVSRTPVLFLTVREDNEAMRSLCCNEGFREIGEVISPQGNRTVFSVHIREG